MSDTPPDMTGARTASSGHSASLLLLPSSSSNSEADDVKANGHHTRHTRTGLNTAIGGSASTPAPHTISSSLPSPTTRSTAETDRRVGGAMSSSTSPTHALVEAMAAASPPSSPSSRTVTQWIADTTTPPLHPFSCQPAAPPPAALDDAPGEPLILFTPAPASPRQSEPRRRRPTTTTTMTTTTATLQHATGASASAGAVAAAARISLVGSSQWQLPSSGTPVRGSGPATPRTRPSLQRHGQDEEELTQLARSLRSEIAGEHFLLTAAFSPTSRVPGSGSRPASAFSNASAGGSGSGDRRRSSKQRHEREGSASPIATAAAAPPIVPMVPLPVTLPTALASQGSSRRAAMGVSTAPMPEAAPLPSPQEPAPLTTSSSTLATSERQQVFSLPVPRLHAEASHTRPQQRRATSEKAAATTTTTRSHRPSTTTATRRALPRDGSASALSPPAQNVKASDAGRACCVGESPGCADGLHTMAELRHRLLTEDFFSSPIRKFRRDGKFPWKLATSVALCVLLLLQVTCYQLPLARANESMRRAITERFMGDDYESKGHGDIVSVPTAWMEGLYASVEHYVAVYYDLSNTSSSDMNYYVFPPGNISVGEGGHAWVGEAEHAATLLPFESTNASTTADVPVVVTDELKEKTAPASLSSLPALSVAELAAAAERIDSPVNDVAAEAPVIPISSIAPVRMRVKVDAFSRREGAQHIDASYSALAALSSGNWWGWTSSSTLSAGRLADDEMENSETRWLTFYVDAAHPLGPFAKYRDAARRLRRAGKSGRRQAHMLRKAEKEMAKRKKKGDAAPPKAKEVRAGQLLAKHAEGCLAFTGTVNAALAMVCTPRLDTLSGRYYRPCTSVPATLAPATTGNVSENDEDTTPPPLPSSFFPEFSLMDNVREIRLEVTLRHETGDVGPLLLPSKAPQNNPRVDGSTLDVSSFFRGLCTQSLTGSAAAEEAAVFQWKVEKVIEIHPGGLVETQLHVETRVWPKGTSLRSRWGSVYWLAALLGLLALFELILRVRALWRIRRYQDRLRKERVAFNAQLMRQQRLQRSRDKPDSAGAAPFSSNGREQRMATAAAAAIPYEWGFPGTPAVRCVPDGPFITAFALPETAATHYGTTALPFSGSAAGALHHAVGGQRNVFRGEGERTGRAAVLMAGAATAAAAGPSSLRLPNESTPLLMHDTSLSILAVAGGTTAFLSDADGEEVLVPASNTASAQLKDRTPFERGSAVGRRIAGSWFGRQLGRVFPHHLTHERQRPGVLNASPDGWTCITQSRQQPTQLEDPGRLTADSTTGADDRLVTPTSGRQRGSFRVPLQGSSPLTPQLTERIMERSYVDLRTTWRHHLQQTMGTGWHWVGLVAATLTLIYSALVLLPLLPGVEVAQNGRYDAWTSVLLGTAALTSCVLLLSYLRFFPTLYFPILASTHVLPKLFLFALCVSPLFFGFAFFFKIAFGPYSDGHFDTLGWASMVLYMMTYGDSLLDTVDIITNTPYAVTAFFANVMVIVFALLFMTIMLNIAMTITQHEWLRLRRRFGSALSTSSLLFAVRSRAEVKAEAVEAVRANLEVLWFMLAEEEEEAKEEAEAAARSELASDVSGSGEAPSDAPLPARMSDASSTSSVMAEGAGAEHDRGQHAYGHHHHHRGRRRAQQQAQQHQHQPRQQQQQQQRSGNSEDVGPLAGEVESWRGGGTSRGIPTGNSSYNVSAATTVPPD